MFNKRKMLFGLAAGALVIGLSLATADRADAQVITSQVYYGHGYPVYGSQVYYGPVYTTTPYWSPSVGLHVYTGYPYVRSYVPRTTYRIPGVRVRTIPIRRLLTH